MQKYSITYLVTIGFTALASYLGVQASDTQIQEFITVGAALILGFIQFYRRYQDTTKPPITVLGVKK